MSLLIVVVVIVAVVIWLLLSLLLFLLLLLSTLLLLLFCCFCCHRYYCRCYCPYCYSCSWCWFYFHYLFDCCRYHRSWCCCCYRSLSLLLLSFFMSLLLLLSVASSSFWLLQLSSPLVLLLPITAQKNTQRDNLSQMLLSSVPILPLVVNPRDIRVGCAIVLYRSECRWSIIDFDRQGHIMTHARERDLNHLPFHTNGINIGYLLSRGHCILIMWHLPQNRWESPNFVALSILWSFWQNVAFVAGATKWNVTSKLFTS